MHNFLAVIHANVQQLFVDEDQAYRFAELVGSDVDEVSITDRAVFAAALHPDHYVVQEALIAKLYAALPSVAVLPDTDEDENAGSDA